MMMDRRTLSLSVFAGLVGGPSLARTAKGPVPFGATPSARQYDWQRLETYGFMHYTMNAFTDREWGYGDEPVGLFNPTDFSADQIVMTAKGGGLKGIILTAKHHDGFCLWPSRYTEHSVKFSPYKNGKGDIVGEMAEACRKHGLKFGVYLSPWDRNHAEYGRPAYVEYYHNQLEELTTQYGPLFEVWFDGANGGDGYYGGARERRKIDALTYYGWDTVRAIVRKNQPHAVMFADEHMDVRWVGNEHGQAGDPCWPTVDETPYTMAKGNAGVRGGKIWNPAETNTSIRPGWFWHADESPRTPANLTRVYFESVGRGTTLLLNLAPDRRGRVPDADVASLSGWKAILDKTFARNLATGAKVTASSTYGEGFGPAQALKANSFWAARTSDKAGAWIRFDLPKAQTFDVIRTAEDIRKGVRVDDFAIDILENGRWRTLQTHTYIGYKRLTRLSAPVTTRAVRIRILKAAASPVLGDFGLFLMPPVLEEPSIGRDRTGQVKLSAAEKDVQLFYTVDGSAPTTASTLFTAPFPLPEGGHVQAVAFSPARKVLSAVSTAKFDVAPVGWRVVSASSDTPDALLEGKGFVGRKGQPAELVLDLGKVYDLKGFTLTPGVQDIYLDVNTVAQMGAPAGYIASVSADGQTFTPVAEGEFSNIANSRSEQRIRFDAPHKGRYLKLGLPRAVQDKPTVAFSSVGVITQ